MDPTISATKVTYLCDTEKFIVGARHGICIKMSSQGQSSSRSRVGQCVGIGIFLKEMDFKKVVNLWIERNRTKGNFCFNIFVYFYYLINILGC